MKLKLATDLSLPIDTVTEKLAWLGRTGSGKTYGAMKLAELMLEAGAQVGALDPVGVWRALRVPAEKGGTSFEVVVFGGLYGDLPLEPTAGELMADLVVDRGLSFVLDVSQFIPSEQQRFVRAFADRFFHRKKSAPSAVHLFLEECQEFIPENPSGEEAKTLGVMQRLWKLGRNFGIGGSLISQRPQEIAKKALNMSGTLFAFQMTGPQERKAIRSWVADQGVAVDIEGVLQKLQVGEPHVESPTFLQVSKTVRILPRVTADLSSTPKVGASTVAKRPLTPIDVEQLKTSMTATIERAKAADPRELRKQIAELKKQLSLPTSKNALPIGKPPKTVEKFVLKDGQLARLEKAGESFGGLSNRLFDLTQAVQNLWKDIKAAVEQTRQPKHPTPATRPTVPGSPHTRGVTPAAPVTSRRPARVVSDPAAGELGKGERQVLIAIAQHADGVTREQLTQLTGYKRSTRDTYIQRLSQRGAIQIDNVGIMASEEGLALLGDDYEVLPTGDDLRAYWLDRLTGGEKAILEALCVRYPTPMTRDALSDATGYRRSSRDTYLQRLTARRLVVVTNQSVSAAPELFS